MSSACVMFDPVHPEARKFYNDVRYTVLLDQHPDDPGYKPAGGYPWERWQRLLSAVLNWEDNGDLIALGATVMRTAFEHDWPDSAKIECGWADGGAVMAMQLMLWPGLCRERWEHLLATDGECRVWAGPRPYRPEGDRLIYDDAPKPLPRDLCDLSERLYLSPMNDDERQQREATDAAVADLLEHLPELTGSAMQVEWGGRLRDGLIRAALRLGCEHEAIRSACSPRRLASDWILTKAMSEEAALKHLGLMKASEAEKQRQKALESALAVMPPLDGTPAQVSWADNVRAKVVGMALDELSDPGSVLMLLARVTDAERWISVSQKRSLKNCLKALAADP
ncbi:hypothetical protein D3877_28930 [Azospirillum cavernae]|uniref:Uncharacterized protein n=1 Tax=Azospirillum cavernae TaxID=2320860 RepID=A0A418VK16_9PROT|nr:hypothetical protein D3877_28930 [Azospirillum cavernae]